MTKVKTQALQRNWVAKHNFNRPARHRDRTQYQRREKHQHRSEPCHGS